VIVKIAIAVEPHPLLANHSHPQGEVDLLIYLHEANSLARSKENAENYSTTTNLLTIYNVDRSIRSNHSLGNPCW